MTPSHRMNFMSKPSKGATSVIRNKLKFNDEHLWRKFSSRRLQLVDALSLSSKKASEQDEEIQICARTLMQEFNFPPDTLGEFDKLVRLAIQSVRRNKRRSEKRQEITSNKQKANSVLDSDLEEEIFGVTAKKVKQDDQESMNYLTIDEDNNESTSQQVKPEETASRLAVSSLVAPIFPDQDRLPSLKYIYTDPKFHKSANKILQTIKKSRTCFEFSTNVKNTMNVDLLEDLGSSCIHSAVLLTLEKWFDHLLPDSCSYIKMRLKSNHTLATIVKKLDSSSLEVNGLNDYLASSLFKRLIGACTKDFGFDVSLNPLCDIFHNTILKDFPILTRDPTGKEDAVRSTYFTADKPIIDSVLPSTVDYPLSTSELPIPPPSTSPHHFQHHPSHNENAIKMLPSLRQNHQSTPVKIKFQQKELTFHYNPSSNAPPTIMELIINCKDAFGIVNSARVLHLRDLKTKKVFWSDFELERVLRMNSMWGNPSDEITLELIFTNVVQDYLNLNYEQVSTSKKEGTPPLNMAPVINKAPVLQKNISSPSPHQSLNPIQPQQSHQPSNITTDNQHPHSHPQSDNVPNTNNNNEALTDRYLPLPRPQGPRVNKRVFMKFQPLL